MLRKILFLMVASLLVLTACTSVLAGVDPATPLPQETPAGQTPDSPIPSEDPVQETPSPDSWAPAPGDEKLNRDGVEIEKAEVITLESFPPQFQLHVVGWKGTPCHKLRVEVGEPDAQNRVEVEIYTLIEPETICVMMLEGFDIHIPLGSFEQGEYTIWLNGQQVGEISAP